MIPYIDLKAQYRSIKSEIDAAVLRVLENATFILGPDVAAFERAFAVYTATQHCVGVNSGTSALHLALLAAGVGPGDDVITVPFTFLATASAIRYTGARVVFVDIDPQTFTMVPEQLQAAITPCTKVIMPVHLFGHPADMDPILEIANRHGVTVIEDAAQAHGAQYKGRPVGSMGKIAGFSFYPGKNLGAYGEGGAAVTNDPTHEHAIRILRDWGQESRYYYAREGFNYRMEGLQGAILGVKLRYLDQWIDDRRRNAAHYNEILSVMNFRTPKEMPWARHAWCVYVLRSPHRDRIQAALQKAGIHTGIHYPVPLHLFEIFADLGYQKGQFPCAESMADEVLSLPLYPELTFSQIDQICEVIGEFR